MVGRPVWRQIGGAAAGLLLGTSALSAHDFGQGLQQSWFLSPYAGMYGSMGNVYSPYYRQFRRYGMQGTTVARPGLNGSPVVPRARGPYAGMYGSMGNVYSPYYRQYHVYGMSGMAPATGMSGMSSVSAFVSPYAGMYGSMGNVYSPYYRQFHTYGMSGQGGDPRLGPVVYPTFLPPTMGTMAGIRPVAPGAGAR